MTDVRAGGLRVLLIAQQPMARAALRGLLAQTADVEFVGQSIALDDAALLARRLEPEVVLADWHPPSAGSTIQTIGDLGALGYPVVIFGDPPGIRDLRALLAAGARGFLQPDTTADDLGIALLAARQGLLVLDPLLGQTLAANAPTFPVDVAAGGIPVEPLTERELEVLQFLALGLPNKTIASRLRISEHTVKFHVGSILAKLNATSRTDAVTRAVRGGLLTL